MSALRRCRFDASVKRRRTLGHLTDADDVKERWSDRSSAGNAALVAMADNGALAGVVSITQMVVLHRPSPLGRITFLVVDTAMRGRGVGSELVASAEHILADAGCGLLEISSNVRRVDAHAFLQASWL